MEVYFRKHREGLFESLETEKKFKSFDDLKEYLSSSNKLKISYYCYDNRCGIGTTFIVTDDGGVLGFAYLRDKSEYVKINNAVIGGAFDGKTNYIHILKGIGKISESGKNASYVEIEKGSFMWIENKYLEKTKKTTIKTQKFYNPPYEPIIKIKINKEEN